ncbi:response regulator [Anaerolineales bacterium HSG25]|nr:response regulator [Anaerolineales bacterium HSG25]
METITNNHKQILLVDNEPRVAISLARGLRALGDDYRTKTAFSSDIAISMLEETDYHLLITDYGMPKHNGLDIIELLRIISPETKTILMVANGSPALQEKAQAAQVDGYLEKPFTLDRLRTMIKGLLR